MATKRVIAYVLDETGRAAAVSRLADPVTTDSYVIGTIDDGAILVDVGSTRS